MKVTIERPKVERVTLIVSEDEARALEAILHGKTWTEVRDALNKEFGENFGAGPGFHVLNGMWRTLSDALHNENVKKLR